MKISLKWLNNYLDAACNLEQVQNILESHGFPVEGVENATSRKGELDFILDVEVTSNRGDCLSHLGIAREVAAGKGLNIKFPNCSLPALNINAKKIEQLVLLQNHEPTLCSLYTARVITGVKIEKSPGWLIDYLGAVGIRSVNNVVDITNFVLMELGQPLHAFDLNKLADKQIHIRNAAKGEEFTAIDNSQHKLDKNMLVIADGKKPVAAAGVMGGKETEVTSQTCDILLEAAVFDPVAVRYTSRKLKIPSDSSYRFERRVDRASADLASIRATQLILEIAGGQLANGLLCDGEKIVTPRQVSLRTNRCNSLLGVEIDIAKQAKLLDSLDLSPQINEEKITCTIPSYRKDLTREVDLIEEIARLYGLDSFPLQDKIHIVAKPPQAKLAAKRILRQVLSAHGDNETVTLGFVSIKDGNLFLDKHCQPALVDDQRRKAAPMLRPSIMPSLLACHKQNQDRGNTDVKLYELASCWHKQGNKINEKNQLCIVRDCLIPELALRKLRCTIEELLRRLGGQSVFKNLKFAYKDKKQNQLFQVSAGILLNGEQIGHYGLFNNNIIEHFGLQNKIIAAELNLPALLALYPPIPETGDLPRFPPIERDLSLIVEEKLTWQEIKKTIDAVNPKLLEKLEFLTVYRGKPIEKGKKSVSIRMRFRNPQATLRHQQVDPQMRAVTEALSKNLGARLRG